LGWPSPQQYGRELDVNGALRNSRFKDAGRYASCISLYGDSFTLGSYGSSLEKSWAHLLADRLDCYVANFAAGGYGTDQAYVRFERNQADRSAVVILGVHPENVLRNLTRIRDLYSFWMGYEIKPRFVLNQRGELELVPLPELT